MENVGIFYGHLAYFTAIQYAVLPYGKFCGYFVYIRFPALVCCTNTNLATLAPARPSSLRPLVVLLPNQRDRTPRLATEFRLRNLELSKIFSTSNYSDLQHWKYARLFTVTLHTLERFDLTTHKLPSIDDATVSRRQWAVFKRGYMPTSRLQLAPMREVGA
jgi:hypothetical protein